MLKPCKVELGTPCILEFQGPDTIRFLNGQLTQDVRLVAGQKLSLPSCVTDGKAKIQFRVDILEISENTFWIVGLVQWAEDLEARLTRYLIADDVEVRNLTGEFHLTHALGDTLVSHDAVIARDSNRYGVMGQDYFVPTALTFKPLADIPVCDVNELESFRIRNGVPKWGREVKEGMLPPEVLLDRSDCSYQKGCYIGQEVLSRIKSAGKVNQQLTRFTFDAEAPVELGSFENGSGELTSIAPHPRGAVRDALGFTKRGASEFLIKGSDSILYPVTAEKL